MSTADDFTVFRRVAGDKIWELTERAEKAERELAAKDKELADIRAERLRNETFWLGFLQDKLAAQQESTNEKNTTQTNL